MRFFLAFLLTIVQVTSDEHIVLSPITASKDATIERMVLFIPGGKVPNNNYTLPAQAIQEAAVGVKLWVVIPAVFQRLCIIQCSSPSICAPLKSTVDDAIALAAKQGWKGMDEQIFIAGHSLGGTCAQYLVQAYATINYPGLIIMGSYVDETGKGALAPFRIPVMTFGAELDGGIARPGKLAIWVRQFEAIVQQQGLARALRSKPVVIQNSMCHSDFCPGFLVPGDLPTELPRAQSLAAIGSMSAAFLHLNSPVSQLLQQAAMKTMETAWASTQVLTTPILDMLDLEVNGGDGEFVGGAHSPWCDLAQHTVAGLAAEDDSRFHSTNYYFNSSGSFEHSRTKYVSLGDSLIGNNTGHCRYSTDVSNTGTFASAYEIGCKMLSYDRVAQQLKTKAANPSVACGDVNKLAFSRALAAAAPQTLQRFQTGGRPICFEPDTKTTGNIGPVFVYSSISMKDNSTCLAVSSLVLQTKIDSLIFPGVMYCKLLSPARALDWVMTDSLKKSSA